MCVFPYKQSKFQYFFICQQISFLPFGFKIQLRKSELSKLILSYILDNHFQGKTVRSSRQTNCSNCTFCILLGLSACPPPMTGGSSRLIQNTETGAGDTKTHTGDTETNNEDSKIPIGDKGTIKDIEIQTSEIRRRTNTESRRTTAGIEDSQQGYGDSRRGFEDSHRGYGDSHQGIEDFHRAGG